MQIVGEQASRVTLACRSERVAGGARERTGWRAGVGWEIE